MKKKVFRILLVSLSLLGLTGCGKKKSPVEESVDRGIRLEEQAQDAVDKYQNKLGDAEKFLDPE